MGNPGVTAGTRDTYGLRLYLPTMDLGQQPHPGKDLRHGGRQGEAVGTSMIATRTTLELEPSPLQSTHAPSNQAVYSLAALDHRWLADNRDGCHLLVRSSLGF